jgi:hypothetical protein
MLGKHPPGPELRTENDETDNDQQQGYTHPILPFPLPPCRVRYSTKAIGTHICGNDPIFTHDNTMNGWKRRVAKDSHGPRELGVRLDY